MPKSFCYQSEARTAPVSLLVFHCFALTTRQMLNLFQKSGTSVHYLIQRNGKVLSLVPDDRIAYHAGLSAWREFPEKINRHSIGIEIQNPRMGQTGYTASQIASLIRLSQALIKRHHIKPENIVGHADIAPYRKPDPGPCFPWERLAQNGIGLWSDSHQQSTPKKSLPEEETQKLLNQIGYNTVDPTAALYAFTTRFMPTILPPQREIIQREANVFNYWLGKPASEIAQALPKAPMLCSPEVIRSLKNPAIMARLREVAALYRSHKKD